MATQDPNSKKITFRFCRECSNMLYPSEDEQNSALMFACRTCAYSEPASTSCIFRNALKENKDEDAGNIEDIAQDPTVRVPDFYSDAAEDVDEDEEMYEDEGEEVQMFGQEYFGGGGGGGGEQEGETLPPAFCTLCGQEILCPTCEQPTENGVALEVKDTDAEMREKGEDNLVEAERRERALSGAGARGRLA